MQPKQLLAQNVEFGNAGGLDTDGTGWFIGFNDWTKNPPSHLRHVPTEELTAGLCVKWFCHPAGNPNGESKPLSEGRTMSVLVSPASEFRIEFSTSAEFVPHDTLSHTLRRHGDFVIWGPGVFHRAFGGQPACILTVRWSRPGRRGSAINGHGRGSRGESQHDPLTASTFIPVFRARDQVLASDEAVEARRARSFEPHVALLQALAERIGASRDAPDGVPRFDPLDGGINARVLLLQEAPGPRAVGSGFISSDNPDQTAANARHACESAGLSRRDVVRWNAVPWYLGNEEGTKIRPATREDVKRAEPWLAELLQLLSRLQVVVLMGKNAQRLAPVLKRIAPHLRVERTPHCSPLALNYSLDRRTELIETLRDVAVNLRT
ncbi:uracil-DNA glycosylase [Variovorax sp. KBS0712]|uniref:uracil-DNA glycosylase n=1 Tax=Variovorax sp. KBS0712 TaxID=2578111 RepID=UPI00117F18D9|nr:uracil-DNA glycosylase [Variovorax sp. KBS0712]TSD56812.1 uracil-DNA glycosylase [Variovorax sp. KBS0712]